MFSQCSTKEIISAIERQHRFCNQYVVEPDSIPICRRFSSERSGSKKQGATTGGGWGNQELGGSVGVARGESIKVAGEVYDCCVDRTREAQSRVVTVTIAGR